jgi:glycosyltransferase involved in cell wall biosynthesis
LTEHNVPFAEPGKRLRLATRLKDGLLHAVVTLSARNAELRRTWLGEPHNFVGIPPGIHIAEADPDLRSANRTRVRDSLGIPGPAVVIASVSRLADDKGLDDLVRAFASVGRETPCDLLLVGDGPLRERLQALATDLAAGDRIHFVGYQIDPGAFLDASDIFALAAPLGSGSVALLEAMARGLPAVITYCGRGEFLVPDETGLCAPPRDPAGLARVLLRLVRDPDRRSALGVKAAARARDRFRIEDVARDLLEVYACAKGAVIPERLRAARLDTW